MKRWEPVYISQDSVEQQYIDSLWRHITFVRQAGIEIGVSPRLLEIHDNSKWSEVEFGAYARHFHGGGDPANFAVAWLHHIHHNPHHWQHWIFPDGYSLEGSNVEPGGVAFMPDDYALEMIADWMGASRLYTGSFDLSSWLVVNIPTITVHSRTTMFLRRKLADLGYGETMQGLRFANEPAPGEPEGDQVTVVRIESDEWFLLPETDGKPFIENVIYE